MTATLVGQVSIGQVVPTTASLVAAAVTKLEASLFGIAQIQASIGVALPTVAARITAAENLLLALKAQLAVEIALGAPVITIDLTAMLAVAADLNAQLALLVGLTVTLGTAGVFVFTQQGDSTTYGAEMQAQVAAVSPPGNVIRSVTFMSSDPAVFEALGKVLLTG